jgi:hypothetical protein
MENFKITTKIISKDEILNSYSEIDSLYKSMIEYLYTGSNNNGLTVKNISVSDYRINNSSLSEWNDYSGVYIFMKDRFPVYIGKAGTASMNFLERINQELACYGPDSNNQNKKKNNCNTLSRKIQTIDLLLNSSLHINNQSDLGDYSLTTINSFYLIFVKSGEKGDNDSATALEAVLVALFHPKYNK